MESKAQVTLLLNRWQEGDQAALDQLIPEVYQQLRKLAAIQLNKNKKNSIQCTELISETYLRLIDVNSVDWKNRTHFFSMAARTMRRVLVDKFRKSNANKRGNNQTLLTYKEDIQSESQQSIDLDELERALVVLEKLNSRHAEIVTLKFFGGLNNQEIAEVLTVSKRTVQREWSVARLWLYKELHV